MPRRVLNPSPLNILFVTPECAPWVKTGGLGDVSAALPRALCRLGHDVRVLMPAYRPLRALMASSRRRETLPAHGPWPEAQLVEVRSGGLTLLLLDCPGFYDRDGGPYVDVTGADYEDGLRRFAFLSATAARLAVGEGRAWGADVLHAHDWPTGLAPAYLREMRGQRPVASVFTVHNLAFQGNFPRRQAVALGMPTDWLRVEGLLHWEEVCLMKAGLQYADAITTVSPTYAREIQQPETGCGLDGVLRARAHDLHGILNGIDTTEWNPATDPHLAAPYDRETLSAKAKNKQALQQRLGLVVDEAPMLFGLVSRLTGQKGVDLVLDNADWLVAQGHQLTVLGQGEPDLARRLEDLARRHPGQVAATTAFDESLAHLIEAGSDAFLMPSRFEPCGLNQMYSQAYGTLPIVRATGGLADSVVDASKEGGTGFIFPEATPESLRGAMQRAVETRASAAAWWALQQRAMSCNFDWTVSARCYEGVYRQHRTALQGRAAG